MADETRQKPDPSEIATDSKPEFAGVQVARETSSARTFETQLSMVNSTSQNSDRSDAVADSQPRTAASQTTHDAPAVQLPANPQPPTASTAQVDGLAPEGRISDVSSKESKSVDVSAGVAAGVIQASVEAALQFGLPMNAHVGSVGGAAWNQQATNVASKEASVTIVSKNPTPATASAAKATDVAIGKTATTASGARTASSSAQSSSQSSQNSNGNSDQAGSTSARAAASSLPQVQAPAISAPGLSHEIASSARMPEGLADGTRPSGQTEVPVSNQQEIGEGAVTTVINSAKLIQAMGQTEMRVGLHTSDFGDISIRTTGSQQQMSAQISLDHSELSQTIAAHISSVQTKLGEEHGIQASIQINNQGSSHSSDSQQPSQRQHNAFAGSARSADVATQIEADKGTNLGILVTPGNDHRLDIRA